MAEAVVTAVVGNLNNLAVQETAFLCGVTVEVAFLKEELMRLRGYLKDADSKQRSGSAGFTVFVSQIRDAAYKAENVIEAADYLERRNRIKKGFFGAISRYARLPTDLMTLHKVGIEVQHVKRRLSEIFQSAEHLKITLDNSTVHENQFPQDNGFLHQNFDDVGIVGFQDEYKEIVGTLLDKESMLSAVSIVAMGGAGKTTLARKVYGSSRVRQHFDTVAWVTVSETFKGIDLLRDIMDQIIKPTDESNGDSIVEMDELGMGKKIHDILFKKRYLLVLDDVWEDDTWEKINRTIRAFPDAANGSRVLLTTRKGNVASHVEMPTHVHALKQLDAERSWELFSSKALPSYRRSAIPNIDEFEQLGRKLARKCDGLPLALALLGGYLSKNLNITAWSKVLLGLPSNKNIQMILGRSYRDLPNHYLRSCLLYLAAFPEDFIVSVSDLIELWIAESFIPYTPMHTVEETARTYVTELAQRSLVQVVQRSKGHGYIEKIRIHDVLRDWCIEEARHDGFLDVTHRTAGQASESFSDTVRFYRFSIQNLSDQILQARLNVRTLLGFGLPSVLSLAKLRFLRVLHVENSSLRDFYMVINGCIHLRCLRLRKCKHVMLPSSIGKLLYLQTIDLRGTPLDSVVPKSVWYIPSLRHVYLCDVFSPPARNAQQKELQTLCLEYCNKDMVTFLGLMTQLRTFSLVLSLVPKGMLNIFSNMPHLVDISLGRFDENRMPEIHYQALTIRRCGYPVSTEDPISTEDPMKILEKLPSLVVLRLDGCLSETLSCSSQGFPRLRELILHEISNQWRVEEGAMPNLSYLELRECNEMSRLPEGLLHLPPLKCLNLNSMHRISGEDTTLKALQQKGCKVARNTVRFRSVYE